MHTKLKIIIPIRGPEDDESLDNNYLKLLGELKNLGKNNDFKHLIDNKEEEYQCIEELKFKVIYSSKYYGKEDEEIKSISKRYKFFHSEWVSHFLEIELIVNKNHQELPEIVTNFILKRFSLVIHLAYNLKLDLLSGVIFNANNYKRLIGRTEIIISTIDIALVQAIKVNWPKIRQPTLNKTISWFNLNNFHPDDISQTNVQRAINAFSYNFSDLGEKDTSQLFWTMIGIESLLAEGTNNIISQIKIKASLILGEPKEFKKNLQKLYNYRSRFIHGDINFPPKFSMDYEGFEREYWDYSTFAISILIALIKELIIENKTDYKFVYKQIK